VSNAKVFILMAAMTGLLLALGQLFGGQNGLVLALLLAGAMNLFMYFGSASLVLRMYRAQVVDRSQAPELYDMVDRLRRQAGLPMPTLAVSAHAQPNAFATGRNPEHSVVCVTQGLVRLVSRDEMEGIVAHELAHIKNRDMLLQTVAATMAGAVSYLAHFGFFFGGRDDDGGNPLGGLLMLILAPLGAMVIQMAISRQREFKADLVGARISGRPRSLASALRQLDAAAHQVPMQVNPAAASLAIVNPLAAVGGGIAKLFSTHPPTEERVARLEAMAAGR
jgi:heat shock protein HtpX